MNPSRQRVLRPVSEVRDVLAAYAVAGPTERVPLARAHGARLARDVRIDRDIPPFDRAAVDGYAIRLEAGRSATPLDGDEFEVIGEIAAGRSTRRRLRPGQAMQIMTGAPCPPGSDGVVMVERSERVGDRVRLRGPFEIGRSPGIARRGEDARRGAVALAARARIGPSQISVLAGIGCVNVPIVRRTRLDLWVTGDEIVAPHLRPSAAQIRNSNGPSIGAILDASRTVDSVRSRRVRDTRAALARSLERSDGDVIVFTGGVSMGLYDLVPAVLDEVGFETLIHGVTMRPGKPFLFAVRGRGRSQQVAFGLPGNPVSSFVAAWEFLLPFLRRRAGDGSGEPYSLTARLDDDIDRKPGLTHFVLGDYSVGTDGRPEVRPVASHGSGDYLALGRSNCLIPLDAERPQRARGDGVAIHPFGIEPIDGLTARNVTDNHPAQR